MPDPMLSSLRAAGGTALTVAQPLTALGVNEVVNLVPPPPYTKRPVKAKAIDGSRNELIKWGAVPSVFGRLRYYPKLLALPVEEVEGTVVYSRIPLTFGYGPAELSELKVGDIPFSRIPTSILQYEVRPGYTASNPNPATGQGDPPLTLFPDAVKEELVDATIASGAESSQRTSGEDAEELAVDIVFPEGVGKITMSTGKLTPIELKAEVFYRAVGAAWPTKANGPKLVLKTASADAITKTLRFAVPTKGKYEVKVKNTSGAFANETKAKYLTKLVWSTLRTIKKGAPTNLTGLCVVVLRVKVTDLTAGVLDQVSGVFERVLPYWNGSSWVAGKTRAPEAAFRRIAQGPETARPRTDGQVDLASLQEWAVLAKAAGFYFDGAFEGDASTRDRLEAICSAARASLNQRDGKVGVVYDWPKTTVAQFFGLRNTYRGTMRATDQLVELPHAIRVFYRDPKTNQQAEVRAYNTEDGYSSVNSTSFEVLDLEELTTDREQAWKLGRYHLAAARLRRAIYEREVDLEFLECGRGSLVRVQDDTVLWGTEDYRVQAVQKNGGGDATGVTLDGEAVMETAKLYALRFRKADSSFVLANLNTVVGTSRTFTFASAIPAASPQPEVGDLCAYGEQGKETVEALVRSIEPSGPYRARVTFHDYAAGVFTADSGTIPSYDARITEPAPYNTSPPAAPAATAAVSGVTPQTVTPAPGNSRLGVKLFFKNTGKGSKLSKSKYLPKGR